MIEAIGADRDLVLLMGAVVALLVVASVVGFILSRKSRAPEAKGTIDNLNARIRAWWVMVIVFSVAVASGGTGSLIMFGVLSLLALREFMTLSPTRRGDHVTLFLSFFVLLPLQYYLIAIGWYGFFAILIPVYGFIFIATRSVLSGDTTDYLARTATINWGLMVCVYCLSHAPALLMLELQFGSGYNATLLFFLVLVVQLSDVLQYVAGKLWGRRRVAPTISPNKTWEGLIGGVAGATAAGAAISWATPFTPLQAAGLALLISIMGFAGGLVMSAIKRDRGVKDFGTALSGHGGVLDRIDSLCFAAPIFFHITAFFFGV
ncbi:MAG TPA: phosphatidate cytidylyltransferase [Gemmatimonadaceae bacterium]|nr:phosphatidate cytidylyltransferase [Gemmatimonadaceae bacterium]